MSPTVSGTQRCPISIDPISPFPFPKEKKQSTISHFHLPGALIITFEPALFSSKSTHPEQDKITNCRPSLTGPSVSCFTHTVCSTETFHNLNLPSLCPEASAGKPHPALGRVSSWAFRKWVPTPATGSVGPFTRLNRVEKSRKAWEGQCQAEKS